MSANPALPILITLLISLLPIAIYCMVLVSINRRPEPLLVRGVWDFAGVLFAVSGIVLWTGPALLATLYQRSVSGDSERTFEAVWLQWWFIWAAYYGLILAGAAFLLWLRRSTTAVYNVQTELIAGYVEATLRRIGFEFAHNSQRQFLITAVKRPPPLAGDDTAITEGIASAARDAAELGPATYCTALELDTFAAMSHVTLHWYESGPCLRDEIEAELRKSLANARAVDNPAALWQSGICMLLFGAIFLSVLFFVLATIFPRRW